MDIAVEIFRVQKQVAKTIKGQLHIIIISQKNERIQLYTAKKSTNFQGYHTDGNNIDDE